MNSVADLVSHFRERLVYFRQLSYILGCMSLIVTVLLVAHPAHHHRERAARRDRHAAGHRREPGDGHRQVLAEGTALTVAGAALGIALGLVTARYLDAILTSFPGLPAAFSFFVPRADALAIAAVVLLVTGSLAGALPGLARLARADRRHASRGGHVTRAAAARVATCARTTR